MSFWNNVLGALRYLNPLGGLNILSDAAKSGSIPDVGRIVGSLINKTTGAGLTDAEREANEFTHNERIDAQNWTAQREDTYYQRTMADMQAAGINPMMAASGSAGVSGSSGGQSVSPSSGSLSDVLQLAMLGPQIQLMKSQANANNAAAKEKTARADYWPQKIEESRAKINLMKDQSAKYLASAMLDMANRDNVNALQPYLMALYTSQRANIDEMTETERHKQNELDQRALNEAAQAAYQKGLIDEGMCHEVVAKVIAEKGLAEAQGANQNIDRLAKTLAVSMRTGTFVQEIRKVNAELGLKADVGDGIIATIRNAFDVIPVTISFGN